MIPFCQPSKYRAGRLVEKEYEYISLHDEKNAELYSCIFVHFFFFSGSKPPEKILIQEILCINMQNLFTFSSEIFRFSAYFLVFCSRFLSETRLLDGRHDRI